MFPYNQIQQSTFYTVGKIIPLSIKNNIIAVKIQNIDKTEGQHWYLNDKSNSLTMHSHKYKPW
jgi:hypothetical protein